MHCLYISANLLVLPENMGPTMISKYARVMVLVVV